MRVTPLQMQRTRVFATIWKPQLPLHNNPLTSRFIPELERTRIVPSMPTFYARNPYHEQNMARLQEVLNKHATLPFDRKSASTTWLKFKQYKEKAGGELLKESEYLQLVTILKRLDAIDVELRSDEMNSLLMEYSKKTTSINESRQEAKLDDKGRAVAVGRRKSSSAKVYLVRGTGEVMVNGKALNEVFPKLQDRLKVVLPLQLVEQEGNFNIHALVRGGGSTGQVDALKLALSKALLIHNPLWKQRLSGAGVLSRV